MIILKQAAQISIHALLAESDSIAGRITSNGTKFLSTLSLRRATSLLDSLKSREFIFLSTLSLRRATARGSNSGQNDGISIHALLAESDPSSTVIVILRKRFLSTLSLRRATGTISRLYSNRVYFYPRSPCGERRRRNKNLHLKR